MTSHVTLADSIQASMVISRSLAHVDPAFLSHVPSRGISFVRMLLLNAACIGSEVMAAFENIYVILTLRYLGVPLPLIGVNSLVSGCVSIVLIPFLGHWTDRGPSPQLRKLSTLVMGACAYLMGLAVVASAAMVKMGTYDIACNATSDDHPRSNLSTLPPQPSTFTGQPCVDAADSDGLQLAGILGILGFSFIDVGFDLSLSVTKAFILEVVPSFQHTSVLTVATSLSALGGMMYSTLGLFDLQNVLSAYFAFDGITATLLLLCGVQVFIVLATYGSSIAVGYSLYLDHMDTQTEIRHRGEQPADSATPANHVAMATQVNDVQVAGFTLPELGAINEEKVLSIDPVEHVSHQQSEAYINENLSLVNKDSLALGVDKQGTENIDSRSNKYSTFSVGVQCSLSMNDAARHELSESRGNKSRIRYQRFGSNTSISSSSKTEDHNKDMTSSNAISSIWSLANSLSISLIHTQSSPLGDFHNRKLLELTNQDAENNNLNPSKLYTRFRSLTSREDNLSPENVSEKLTKERLLNKRVVLLCLASFCTFGNLIATNYYLPNTLTVEILHGDPTAPPDTPEFEAYQSGLRMASLGYLVYYCTSFIMSLCNKKIIDAIGPVTEFIVVTVAMFVVTAALMVTQRQEVFIVVMVFLGFHKCMTYTVVFMLATRVSTSDLGRIMSVVGAMLPLQFLACGVLLGPLMEALGTAWIASWYTLVLMAAAGVFMALLSWDMRKR